MLLSFRVENHRSLRAEQELVLTTVYDKSRPVVPVAAIFGANASGKSNLLDALRFMRHAVLDSYGSWAPGGVPREPFALNTVAGGEPSGFMVQLLLDGVRHIYGFVVDGERVREEWLYAFPHNRRQVIFDREGQHIRPGPTSGPSKRQVAVLETLLPQTALFLTLGGRTTVEEVAPVYRWFADRLDLIMDEDRQPDEHALATELHDDPRARAAVVGLVRAADMGIEDVTVTEPLDGRRRLLFHHSGRSGEDTPPLRLAQEAHGTRVWLSYLLRVLRTLDRGGVLAIDEIELSLHPRLSAHMVDVFHSDTANPHGAQLLFTTHETALLVPFIGDDVLHRDEVWFLSKDGNGETTLCPLSDYKPRKQENTQRRYLTGAYNAVPHLFHLDFEDALTGSLAEDGGRAAS